MSKAAIVSTDFLSRLWYLFLSVTHHGRTKADSEKCGSPSADGYSAGRLRDLPAARLRDLGFEPDQVGGNIDFAKGQHQQWG